MQCAIIHRIKFNAASFEPQFCSPYFPSTTPSGSSDSAVPSHCVLGCIFHWLWANRCRQHGHALRAAATAAGPYCPITMRL